MNQKKVRLIRKYALLKGLRVDKCKEIYKRANVKLRAIYSREIKLFIDSKQPLKTSI